MKSLKSGLIIALLITLFSCEKSSTSSNPVYINFIDVNFEQLIRDALEKPEGDITKTDMETLTELIGNGLDIVDLTGIEYCINLVFLDLSNNLIADISQLVDNDGFDSNDFIDLQGNPLTDTSKDTYIPQLVNRGVFVYYDEPEMIVTFPDANFEALIRGILQKPSGNITNNDLALMTRIEGRNSGVNDIRGIEYCKNLTFIDFYNCGLTDISTIEGLRKLKDLYLYRNNVSNIEYISEMSHLRNVSVGYNNITDISVLSSLPKLEYLSIGNNPIDNLEIISELTLLEYISISSLNLTNLDIISDLINLERIEARNDQISDISALVNLTKMEFIAMNNNQISDISAIANLQFLDDVNFNDNNVTDISILRDLPSVTGIGLGGNQISDISSFSTGLDNIEYIVLRDNQISDLKALVDNNNIGDGDTIYLTNNPLSQTSLNTYIPQLEARGVTVHQ